MSDTTPPAPAPEMGVEEIVETLAAARTLPRAALAAAGARRAELIPRFIAEIEAYLAHAPGTAQPNDCLFFGFHLLGEWRATAAYRPLLRLLRSEPAAIDHLLGDATTATVPRVMAAVFDGDPQPLYDAILDPQADPLVRSSLLECLLILVLHGELARAPVGRFLLECFDALEPRDPEDPNMVWYGWQRTIALLGLKTYRGLVKKAFERHYLDAVWLGFRHFEKDLARGLR